MYVNKNEDLIFNEENHTYTYKGIPVPSVTTILQRTIYFDKYRDVPEDVLKQASERGTLIHKEVENFIKNKTMGFTEELENFVKEFTKMVLDYNVVSSEEQVGNEEYAGTIDLRFINKEGEICMADIKTTSSLDTEYVSWQLSFYAELYEKVYNTSIERLYAIWLRENKVKVVEVYRKSKDEVKAVLKAYREGRAYIPENKLEQRFSSVVISNFANALRTEKITKELKKQIEEYMVENGIPSYENKDIRISRSNDTITREFSSKVLEKKDKELFDKYNKQVVTYEFDEESFKEDYPDLYNECLAESFKKGRFTITLR